MNKLWNIKQPDLPHCKTLSKECGLPPILVQLLLNREVNTSEDIHHFMDADLSRLNDPFIFKGMQEAVDRIRLAQERGEKVMVFGDYDVDGVTSSTLLNIVLTEMGLDLVHHIPHRMTDGYGLNHAIAQFAHDQGVKLFISVDCGITAVSEIKEITSYGIDVIVVDHHEPGEEIPNAVAIVDPKQKDCPYPFKELASVGLVGKVCHALRGAFPEDMLDLMAIGTIADVVPLRGENRILVKAGMPKILETKNKGLNALLDVAKIKGKKLSPFHIGFVIGPRINAAGRMDTAHTSLDLLLAEDDKEAYRLAKELDSHNVTRQKMQREMIQEAFDMIEQEVHFQEHKVIVISKEGWHKGVLGIVASRVAEKYYRPSVVISVEDGVGTASCRSIDGFHLHEALSSCSSCLENFGGHEGAAGLTIKAEQIDPFRQTINQVASQTLEVQKLTPVIDIDADIKLSHITLELAQLIDSLQPYGEGNPTPVLCSRKVTVRSYPRILGKETLKFWVSQGDHGISAVGFGMAKYQDMVHPGAKLDLAYELTIDDWNKSPEPQLKLRDIRLSQ